MKEKKASVLLECSNYIYDLSHNNEKILWSSKDDNDNEIFLYDLSTHKKYQITDNNHDDTSPSMYNHTILWHSYDGGNNEIFLTNINF